MQLINILHEYRVHCVLKNEPFKHLNQLIHDIESQQSEELKDIE